LIEVASETSVEPSVEAAFEAFVAESIVVEATPGDSVDEAPVVETRPEAAVEHALAVAAALEASLAQIAEAAPEVTVVPTSAIQTISATFSSEVLDPNSPFFAENHCDVLHKSSTSTFGFAHSEAEIARSFDSAGSFDGRRATVDAGGGDGGVLMLRAHGHVRRISLNMQASAMDGGLIFNEVSDAGIVQALRGVCKFRQLSKNEKTIVASKASVRLAARKSVARIDQCENRGDAAVFALLDASTKLTASPISAEFEATLDPLVELHDELQEFPSEVSRGVGLPVPAELRAADHVEPHDPAAATDETTFVDNTVSENEVASIDIDQDVGRTAVL
jgi:hypothetical protein